MYLSEDKVIEIFYLADEFCREFDKNISKHSVGNQPKRKPQMSHSEVITIMVLFHLGGFKNLKNFYLFHVPGFHLLIRHQLVFVKTRRYKGTGSLMGLPRGENQPWAISLDLSSIV